MKDEDSKIEFIKKQPYSYEKNVRDVDFDSAINGSQEMQTIIDQLKMADEHARFYDLRARRIISDTVLVINPDHKGLIERVLYSAGIKKVPIIYSDCVEHDKMYAITDKSMVENIKKKMVWED